VVSKIVLRLCSLMIDTQTDQEIDIIHDLQVKVLEHEKALLDCVRVCSELDWWVFRNDGEDLYLTVCSLIALAESAIKYEYTRPTMTEDNTLKVVKGRSVPMSATGSIGY